MEPGSTQMQKVPPKQLNKGKATGEWGGLRGRGLGGVL